MRSLFIVFLYFRISKRKKVKSIVHIPRETQLTSWVIEKGRNRGGKEKFDEHKLLVLSKKEKKLKFEKMGVPSDVTHPSSKGKCKM